MCWRLAFSLVPRNFYTFIHCRFKCAQKHTIPITYSVAIAFRVVAGKAKGWESLLLLGIRRRLLPSAIHMECKGQPRMGKFGTFASFHSASTSNCVLISCLHSINIFFRISKLELCSVDFYTTREVLLLLRYMHPLFNELRT